MQANITDMEQEKKTPGAHSSSVWIGLFLVAAGVLLVAYKLDAGVPAWLVSWPVAVISIGLLVGIYSRFKTFFWAIPFFWGFFLLAEQQAPELDLGKYAAPASLIMVGIILLYKWDKFKNRPLSSQFSKEGFVDFTCLLSNTKKEIITPDFRGADITCILGNTVVDLRKADIQTPVLIDAAIFMGNAKILIPEAWTVQNEISAVFGEAKQTRRNVSAILREDKLLKFNGSAIFSTIEIISC